MTNVHPDMERMIRSSERYKARFDAAFGEACENTERKVSLSDDYRMFGDIIDPKSLNQANLECVQSYCTLFAAKIEEAGGVEDELEGDEAMVLLIPIMAGMFEHAWLLGWMYRDEQAQE